MPVEAVLGPVRRGAEGARPILSLSKSQPRDHNVNHGTLDRVVLSGQRQHLLAVIGEAFGGEVSHPS